MADIGALPNELLYLILSYCREYTIYLGGVSRLWYALCKELREKNNYSLLELLERVCLERDSRFFPYLSSSIFREAIEKGKISILIVYQEISSKTKRKRLRRRIVSSVKHAHLRTIQHYFQIIKDSPYINSLEEMSLQRDDPLFLEWLQGKIFISLESYFYRALRLGKVKLLSYLEKEVEWRRRGGANLYLATTHRSFSSLLWLKERGIFKPSLEFLIGALIEERVDLLEELWENTERRRKTLLEQSLLHGKEKIFLWLLERTGQTLYPYLFWFAREEKTRELLYSLGCPWDEYCYIRLIDYRDVKGIDWAKRRGYPFSLKIITRGLFSNLQQWFLKLLEERKELLDPSLLIIAKLREEKRLISSLITLGCPLYKD